MKALITGIIMSLLLAMVCIAATNTPSFFIATNEADFARFMSINQQRTREGQKPLPIRVSRELSEKLVSDVGQPAFADAPQSIALSFSNAPLSLVLEEYTSLTGKKVLIEKELFLPITVATKDSVSQQEAIALIEKALALKGIVLEPVDEKTVKATRKQEKDNATPPAGDVLKAAHDK